MNTMTYGVIAAIIIFLPTPALGIGNAQMPPSIDDVEELRPSRRLLACENSNLSTLEPSALLSSLENWTQNIRLEANFRVGEYANTQIASSDHRNAKTTGAAFRYSLIGTVGPILLGSALMMGSGTTDLLGGLLVGSGMLFGPSIGHAYAHSWGRFAVGPVLRAAAGFSVILGIAATLHFSLSGEHNAETWAPILVIGGLVVYVGSVVLDLATLSRSVEKYNSKHAISLRISPTYTDRAVGAKLVVGFEF